MQIGWIDFSDKDRKRAIDVLHLLGEGAVDELGIGVVRDAFADYFFPGTSTIQTRAKYFFLVPYALRSACAKYPNASVRQVMTEMSKLEKQSAQVMKDNGEEPGIIGASVLPRKWVVRQPSAIYWNGIRTYGIMTAGRLSMSETIAAELGELKIKHQRTSGKIEGEEGAEDDKTIASGSIQLWDSLLDFHEGWINGLNINLTPQEASYLRERISTSKDTEKSLLKYLLDNNIRVDDIINESETHAFKALSDAIDKAVTPEMQKMLRLANLFDILVYALRVRYNFQMGNEYAVKLWEDIPNMVKELKNLDLSDIFCLLNVSGRVRKFLLDAQTYLLREQFDELDQCILSREKELKSAKRCKLLQKERYKDTWIGGTWLDYRLFAANNILRDIYEGEKGGIDA